MIQQSFATDYRIVDIEAYVPQQRLTSSELAPKFDLTEDFIREKKRLTSVPWEQGLHPSAMAIHSGRRLLERTCVDSKDIRAVMFAGSGLGDFALWSAAARVQYELGADQAASVDVLSGCTSGHAAVGLLSAMLKPSDKNTYGLIATAERLTLLDKDGGYYYFSDGAACILLSHSQGKLRVRGYASLTIPEFHGMNFGFEQGTCWLAGATGRTPQRVSSSRYMAHFSNEYGDAFRRVSEACAATASLTLEQVEHIVVGNMPPEKNDGLPSALGVPANKIKCGYEKYGHMGSPDTFLTLKELVDQNTIQKGDQAILVCFGAGHTWTGVLVERVE